MQLQVEAPRGAAPVAAPAGVGFAWRPGLFGLLIKNAVLSVITLSIYRFWARTMSRIVTTGKRMP